MSLELCILASGSSGNSTVLRTPGGVVLIDAGIGPRAIVKRMDGSGVGVSDVKAICLTHLDRDHFSPTWFDTICKRNIKLFCHADRIDTLRALTRDCSTPVRIDTFNGKAFEPVERVRFHAISLEHDAEGSHGFVIEGFGAKIGYATDLGRVPKSLLEHFCGVDLLAIESNYDREMELSSPRPWFLKQRIMGGKGHLSNEQAFEAVRAILDRCQSKSKRLPQHIVLLHRSRQCNCPTIVRKLFESDERIAPRLTLAEQYERTSWLAVKDHTPLVGEQLSLQFQS